MDLVERIVELTFLIWWVDQYLELKVAPRHPRGTKDAIDLLGKSKSATVRKLPLLITFHFDRRLAMPLEKADVFELDHLVSARSFARPNQELNLSCIEEPRQRVPIG